MERTIIIETLKAMLTAPDKNAVSKNDIYEEVRGNYLNFLAAQFFPELKAGNKLRFVEKFIDEDRLVLHDTFVEMTIDKLVEANADLSGLKWDDPDVYEIFYKQVLLPADEDFIKLSVNDDKTLRDLKFEIPAHGPYEYLYRHGKDRFGKDRLWSRFKNLPPVRFTVKVLTKIKTFVKAIAKAFKEMPAKIKEFFEDVLFAKFHKDHETFVGFAFDFITSCITGYGVWSLAKLACEKLGITIMSESATSFGILLHSITPAGWLVLLATIAVAEILWTVIQGISINLQYYEYCKSTKKKYSWLRRKYVTFGDYVRSDGDLIN